jgi:hypothetical protein
VKQESKLHEISSEIPIFLRIDLGKNDEAPFKVRVTVDNMNGS